MSAFFDKIINYKDGLSWKKGKLMSYCVVLITISRAVKQENIIFNPSLKHAQNFLMRCSKNSTWSLLQA